MSLKRSTASGLFKVNHVILLIGLCLTTPLLSQEIIPDQRQMKSDANALALTTEEVNWLKQHPSVQVAVRNGWMPVEFQLENHTHKGVSVQYLEKISKLTGLRLTIQDYHDNLAASEVGLVTGVRGQHPPKGFNLLSAPYLDAVNAIYTATNNT